MFGKRTPSSAIKQAKELYATEGRRARDLGAIEYEKMLADEIAIIIDRIYKKHQ